MEIGKPFGEKYAESKIQRVVRLLVKRLQKPVLRVYASQND